MKERSMIVVAAGSSTRFGADKLLVEVAGRPLITHTVTAIRDLVDHCVLVARSDQIDRLSAMDLGVDIVPGGASRTESETLGLAAVPNSKLIGIHDGARPSIGRGLIEGLFEAASVRGGAVPGLPPARPLVERGTLKALDAGPVRVQTPQVFWGLELKAAYRAANEAGFIGDDTADIVHNFTNLEVVVIPGDPDNIKVTHLQDLERLEKLLA